MVSFRLVQVLLACLPLAINAINIDDYFKVKKGGEKVGGCDDTWGGGSKTGKQWLQTWLEDAETLTNTASDAIDKYKTTLSARENLLIFMGIEQDDKSGDPANADKFNFVKDNFASMREFIKSPPSDAQKLRLFCSSKWMEERDFSDASELTPPSGRQAKKPKITIEDAHRPLLDGLDTQVRKRVKPYWMPDFGVYFINEPGTGSDYCDDQYSRFGGTVDDGSPGFQQGEPGYPGTMTICMSRVFSAGGGVSTLGEKEPTEGATLNDFMSKGITLFHEMFHMVLGVAKTPDTISDLKGVLQTSTTVRKGAGPRNSKTNKSAWLPESLATFAEAQWISQSQKWKITAAGERWAWDAKGNANKKKL